MSLEQGNAETKALYLGHCSANNQYHAELVAELTAKLQGHTQAEIEAKFFENCELTLERGDAEMRRQQVRDLDPGCCIRKP